MTDLTIESSSIARASVDSSDTSTPADHPVLLQARQKAIAGSLPFAGSITPKEAWQLVQENAATLVDVRTNEERKFVGYVPDSLNIAWMTGTSMNRNPRFVKELEVKVKDKNTVVLLLCRSGKRSAAAAEALSKSGFQHVFNITDGFEGNLNEQQQRGHLGGWRVDRLPWVQD